MSDSTVKAHLKPGPWAINWRTTGFFLTIHAIALLALFPWFFSPTGVTICILGIFVFGTLGMSVGYHRLFTHRGFMCPRWLECTFAILGCCCGEESPAYWVAVHRRHHHHSDGAEDPHSPQRGFFWGHVGWLLVKDETLKRYEVIDRYAKDLKRDPFHARLTEHDNWVFIMLASWALFFAAGFGASQLTGASTPEAIQFGLSLTIWGCAVRTVLVWHQTWAINSATHLWGYRNYETRDDSRNNVWAGILCNGDGWHNNHHADPNSAKHGHKWWEFDLAWLAIRLLAALGLVKNVVLPSSRVSALPVVSPCLRTSLRSEPPAPLAPAVNAEGSNSVGTNPGFQRQATQSGGTERSHHL